MNKSFYDYNKTEEIKKGLYLIQDFQGNYGLISSAGEIIVPTNYETYVIAEKNKILFNKGAIKFTPGIAACAEIILDLESIKQTPKNTFSSYDITRNVYGYNLWCVQTENSSGVIDKSGKIIIPFEYDLTFPLEGKCNFGNKYGNIVVAKKSKINTKCHSDFIYGLANMNGEIVLDLEYKQIYAPYDISKEAIVINANTKKSGLISLPDAKFIIPCVCDEIKTSWDKQGEKYSMIYYSVINGKPFDYKYNVS